MRLETTRRAELAVRALALLGTDEQRWKSGDLAARLGATPAFVLQVVGPLVKAGWVRSDPGPAGGYSSVVALDRVSVLDVIEAVEGTTNAGRCVTADRPCDHSDRCILHDAWTRARTALTDALRKTPVADVAAHHDARRKLQLGRHSICSAPSSAPGATTRPRIASRKDASPTAG